MYISDMATSTVTNAITLHNLDRQQVYFLRVLIPKSCLQSQRMKSLKFGLVLVCTFLYGGTEKEEV